MGYLMKMGSKEIHSPMNFKNDDAKLLSLSKGLFGVDTTVETEQKNLARRRQGYLKDKSKYMSALFKDTAPKYFVDYNFKIGNKGDVTMDFRKGSEKKRGLLTRGMYNNTLSVQPSFTKLGQEQKTIMDRTKNYGGQKTSKRQFGYAQEFKDRIVRKQRVNQAKKTIYGDYSERFLNKYK
jgi:hypothetical protein